MFKRSTKLTALLVAAASVASTVPAMAATKLNTKTGTIEKGVAYKDNKYLYQGYRTDDDDNGLYISTAGKDDKKLDDANEIVGKFKDKYVSAKDGSDDFVVDLESGKISDDDTIKDLEKTAETKLTNKIDTAERYDYALIQGTDKFDNNKFNFKRVTGDKFEDNYYLYTISGNAGDADKTRTFQKFGYTNDSGKYIDCSYDLNLYAYSATKPTSTGTDGKMYKVEDIEDKVKTEENSSDITVNDIQFVKYIGQDDKYIYSVIKVQLTGAYSVYTKQQDDTAYHYYVQKVSKEYDDKEKGAYKPKTTECFEIGLEKDLPNFSEDEAVYNDATARIGNGDSETAFKALLGIGEYAGVKNKTQYAIVDGTIYVYYESASDKVKIVKIKLATSEKLDRYYNNGDKDKNSNKISSHVALKSGDQDHKMTDVEDVKNDNGKPWTVDVNGVLWFIKEGSIFKCAKMGDWQEVYTCDRSLDCLDVYDENNLIAWDSDGDVYTTVDEGSKAAKEEAEEIAGKQEQATTEPAVTAKTGWDKLADGTWNYYDATGKKVTGWTQDNGVWYYLDPTTAVMKTGWIQDAGNWYYLNASGAMQTGWVQDGSTWYYCNTSGAMLASQWFQDGDGRWYYLTQSGAMAVNTTIDGYVLGANGAWVK